VDYSTVMNVDNTGLLNAAQNPPTRTGYTFAGWFNAAVGGTRQNHNTSVVPGSEDITLHAQWTPLSRTVVFNPQGGTWPSPGSGTGTVTRTMNQSAMNYSMVMNTNNTTLLNVTQNPPTRTGYTFAGWFNAAVGGIRVLHNTAVTPDSGDITLYAQWTPVVQVVNFNPQGGIWPAPGSGMGNLARTILRNGTYSQAFNVSDVLQSPTQSQPTRTGYAFAGWFDAVIGGTRILSSTAVSGDESRTLYAQWMPLVSAWEGLRTAIESAPENVPHTIQISDSFSAPAGTAGNMITIPVNRDITIVSNTATVRVLTQMNNGQRHFRVLGQLTLGENITLSGGAVNNTNNSGGVQVNVGGIFTMDTGSVIENCRWVHSGGAVHIAGNSTAVATFRLAGGTIQNNRAAPFGGGVWLSSHSEMTMSSGIITGNSADTQILGFGGGGGVAMNANTSSFTMSGGTISENTATLGGGLYMDHGTFTMNDASARIENNTAIETATSPGGGGGIIHGNGTVTITAGEINNNTAPDGGGVWTVATGTNAFTMTGGALRNNQATTGDGGAIFAGRSTLTANPLPLNSLPMLNIGADVTFSDNTAGGSRFTPPINAATATRIQTTSSSVAGTNHPLNNYDINFRVIPPSVSTWEGLRAAVEAAPVNMPHTIEVSNSFFALAGDIGNVIEIPENRNITLVSNNATVRVLTQANNNRRHFSVLGQLTLGNGITLSGGIANNENNSGGVQVRTGGIFTMNVGSVIENCRWGHAGGAVHVAGNTTAVATFRLAGGTIRNNSAVLFGGGVWLGSHSEMTMSGGTITGNSLDTQITGWGFGGGVAMNVNTARFTMSGGTISGNTATLGGGLHMENGTFTMNDASARIENNTAIETATSPGGGGGILHSNGTVTITAGEINNNTAPDGGGVWIVQAGANAFTMTGGALRNNQATTGDGGAIFAGRSTLTANPLPTNSLPMLNIGADVIFANNTAGGDWSAPPTNATTATRILATSSSVIGTNHPLNNYDINYRGAMPEQVVMLDPQGGTWSAPGSGTGILQRTLLRGGTYSQAFSTSDVLLHPTQHPPTRAGYIFAGWFSAVTDGIRVTHSTLVSAEASRTLYAQWTPLAQVVTFNPQGGTWSAPESGTENIQRTILRIGTYAQAFDVSDILQNPAQNPPTRAGYTFVGWFDAVTGGTRIVSSTSVSGEASRTLYAQWTPLEQVVTFNPEGGTWAVPGSGTEILQRTILRSGNYSQAFNASDVLQNPIQNPPIRDGYTFVGWFDAVTNGTRILSDISVSGEASRTLYAQWTPLVQVVTFNPQGGTWPTPGSGTVNVTRTIPRSGTYSQVFNALDVLQSPIQNPPTRTGYTFAGWFSATTGEARVTNNTVVSTEASRTLYAHWTPVAQVVNSWAGLRAAVNDAPASAVTIIQVSSSFSAPAGTTGNAIEIPANRNIMLVSNTATVRVLTQANSGQRHFNVLGELTLGNGITLSGGAANNTNDSGGVQVDDGGTFTMNTGSVIENCRRTDSAAVRVVGSNTTVATFRLAGGTIRNNSTAFLFGGAGVWLGARSEMTMSSGTISGNTAPSALSNFGGGGVFVTNASAIFTMSGGTISGNTAPSGGGVYVAGGIFTMNNATARIENNIATGTGGGGIFQSGGTINITAGEINNNSAPNGGGVRVAATEADAFTMTGGALRNNQATRATGDGGAIFAGASTLTANPLPADSLSMLDIGADVVFAGNTAGGGQFVPPTNATTATRIQAISSSVPEMNHPLNNYDINYRGVFNIPSVNTWDELRAAVEAAPISISHTIRISDNLTTTGATNPDTIVIPADRIIVLESSIATANHNLDMLINGQRHFRVSGQLTLGNGITLRGGVEATNTNNAGGVQVSAGGILTMLENSIIQWVNRTGGNLSDFGGAVNLEGTGTAIGTRATFIMEGGIIRNNLATWGGGVIAQRNSHLIMRDGVISENEATSLGGGVIVSSGTFIMEGGIIQSNTAPSGGGVSVHGNAAGYFEMRGGIISGNRATGSAISNGGGGAFVNLGTFTMRGGTISGNTAFQGGGLRVTSGTFTMDDAMARIEENTATSTAIAAGGGGIFHSGGTVTILEGEINNNSAPNGGGVRVAATAENAFTMTGGALRNNRATASTGDGGAIFAGASTLTENPLSADSLPMLDIRAGVIFAGNTAGGGQFAPPTNVLTATRIQTISSSVGEMNHPLNNYDINYRGVVQRVNTWDDLRAAVEAAPINEVYTIRIADDLTTTGATDRNAIVISADQIIVLTSSETGITRNVDMLTRDQRHFTVYGQLTLGDGITLRGGTTAVNTNNAGGVHVSAGGTLISWIIV